MKSAYVFFALAGALFGCKPTEKLTVPLYLRDAPREPVATTIEAEAERPRRAQLCYLGHFSNKKYLTEHPEVRDIEQEVIGVPLFKDRIGEYWIYCEMYAASLPERPVLHRVFQFARRSPDTLEMRAFRLKEPEKYVNEWRKEKPFEGLKRADVTALDGCDKLLITDPNNPQKFISISQGEWCVNAYTNGGPTRFVRSYYELCPEYLVVQADLFDGDKNLLKPTYARYYRLSPKDPNYRDLTK